MTMQTQARCTHTADGELIIKSVDNNMSFGYRTQVFDIPKMKAEMLKYSDIEHFMQEYDEESQTEIKRIFEMLL